jgi:hypothetical protein
MAAVIATQQRAPVIAGAGDAPEAYVIPAFLVSWLCARVPTFLPQSDANRIRHALDPLPGVVMDQTRRIEKQSKNFNATCDKAGDLAARLSCCKMSTAHPKTRGHATKRQQSSLQLEQHRPCLLCASCDWISASDLQM